MGILSSALGIVNGIGMVHSAKKNKKTLNYISEENRKSAEIQYKYNKSEIDRAFNYNLKAIARDYSNERAGAVEEARQLLSQVNMGTGNIKNVESDSFENDLKDKVLNDITANMLVILDRQTAGIYDLSNTKLAQEYNLGRNLESTISNINLKQMQMNSVYNQQIQDGLMKVGTSALGFIDTLGGFLSSSNSTNNGEASDFSFYEYGPNYISNSMSEFGLKPYDPYEKLY